jgi:hypothetical protein
LLNQKNNGASDFRERSELTAACGGSLGARNMARNTVKASLQLATLARGANCASAAPTPASASAAGLSWGAFAQNAANICSASRSLPLVVDSKYGTLKEIQLGRSKYDPNKNGEGRKRRKGGGSIAPGGLERWDARDDGGACPVGEQGAAVGRDIEEGHEGAEHTLVAELTRRGSGRRRLQRERAFLHFFCAFFFAFFACFMSSLSLYLHFFAFFCCFYFMLD